PLHAPEAPQREHHGAFVLAVDAHRGHQEGRRQDDDDGCHAAGFHAHALPPLMDSFSYLVRAGSVTGSTTSTSPSTPTTLTRWPGASIRGGPPRPAAARTFQV